MIGILIFIIFTSFDLWLLHELISFINLGVSKSVSKGNKIFITFYNINLIYTSFLVESFCDLYQLEQTILDFFVRA